MTLAIDPPCTSVADIERVAMNVLPTDVWDFVAGGSGTEATLAANRAAFDAIRILPRVLTDVSDCCTRAALPGVEAAFPAAVAPVAYHRLLHSDGELATAQAALDAGVPFTVGTLSSVPLEEIASVGAQLWFQLYWLRDRAQRRELVRRAEEAGCRALVLTVDVPWMGRRLRDVRNGFTLPQDVVAANLSGDPLTEAHQRTGTASAVAQFTRAALDPALGWADVEELRASTSLPLVLKGILDPRDAVRAVECGADAVVVSNHGGRQLDGAVSSIDALPHVVAAVAGRVQVLLDSGVRSGIDILRALALGADGVLVGRPVMWGLAAHGADGVSRVLQILAEEFADALGLAGCANVAAARDLLATTTLPAVGVRQIAERSPWQ